MGTPNTTVRLSPSVFRWVVMGAGWNSEELSEKTGIGLESIRGWEKSSTPIRIVDLKKISKTINRPISTLLLPEPLDEKELPNYRKISKRGLIRPSKKMLDVIRHAKYVRSNVNELLQMRSEDVRPNIIHRHLQNDPEKVAESERTNLGMNLVKESKGDMEEFSNHAYLSLKEKIESLNIFVLQMAMEIDEARGFSLSDDDRYPKIIMINSNEKSRPRIFTLLHEYAHILLGTGGICPIDLNDVEEEHHSDMRVERWCNNFAGAVIMPKNAMLAELTNAPHRKPEQMVASLARKFCASKKAITVRILNLIGSGARRKEYVKYNETLQTTFTAKIGGGGGAGRNMTKECINHNGMRYVRLVTDSRTKGFITANDMVRYLDLNTKHFEKLEYDLMT